MSRPIVFFLSDGQKKIEVFKKILETLQELDADFEKHCKAIPRSPAAAQLGPEGRYEVTPSGRVRLGDIEWKYTEDARKAFAAIREYVTADMYFDRHDLKTLLMAYRYAMATMPVLIVGETGVGKSFYAAFIAKHARPGEMQTVNCSMISQSLIESELFGHEKGAFTGATQPRIGKLETADKGTLFIDEAQAATLEAQQKIKTFIETKQFSRVGGNAVIPVDCKIVVASNNTVFPYGLAPDLAHRLYPLHLPAIHERPESIGRFLNWCIRSQLPKSKRHNWSLKLDTAAARTAQWSGNLRQIWKWVSMSILMDEVMPIDGNATQPITAKPNKETVEAEVKRMKAERQPVEVIAQRIQGKYGIKDHSLSSIRRMLKGKTAKPA